MDTHEITLRDINDDDTLAVTYVAIDRQHHSHTTGRHVSSRLPIECLTLFHDGTVDVSALTAEERAWVASESAARSNEIDFAGVNA